jgi:hypothetical protein
MVYPYAMASGILGINRFSARIRAMFRRFFLSLTLVLLFALGQQGAAVHAVSHLADYQQQDDKTHQSSACDQCLTYAKLSSALGSSGFAAPPVVLSTTEYHAAGRSAESSPLRAYGARAPPYLS